MDAAASPGAGTRGFAQVELAGMAIGIPAEYVVRVVPRPAALTVLPRSHDAIEGVFRDRDQLITVVDLCKWMAKPPAQGGVSAHVMLLCVDGRTIGLAVDAVHGLVRLAAEQIDRIHHHAQDDGFFHSVGTGADDALITLLDPAILIAQVGAWGAGAHLDQTSVAGATELAPDSAIQALVRIGSTVFGFPATMVGEIVRHLQLQPLALGGGEITGTTEWRARLTLVVNPARTVLAVDGGNTLTVVLAHDGLTLAFPVDEVLAVRTFKAAQVQDAATAGLDSDIYLGYATEESGRRILLVDGPALLARYALPALDDAGARAKAAEQTRTPLPAHVVYDVGQLCAAPMHALREIVPLPGDYQASAERAGGIDGQCSWRGRMLPVIDLRTPDARASLDSARLMVVHHGEREVGLLVRDVVALLPANTGERLRFSMPGGQAMHMITVGAATERKSYQVLDVETLPYLAA
ncbi:chemotaxis protein CheW [Massilia sp. S19_KUP03_FR1]|uniref:chemotaxis protein CheW n=1 Tax=Massilia sp. S19_KUP03_FR1 TaxID=3025503 RepID=UPI002FCDBED0